MLNVQLGLLRACVLTLLRACVLTLLRACVLTLLRACVLTLLRACVLTLLLRLPLQDAGPRGGRPVLRAGVRQLLRVAHLWLRGHALLRCPHG